MTTPGRQVHIRAGQIVQMEQRIRLLELQRAELLAVLQRLLAELDSVAPADWALKAIKKDARAAIAKVEKQP